MYVYVYINIINKRQFEYIIARIEQASSRRDMGACFFYHNMSRRVGRK